MEELYSYHVYYGKHLPYGIYDSDLLKSLIHQDMTLYRPIFNDIKEEMDEHFHPFLHLVALKYIQNDSELSDMVYNVFNPGLLTTDMVDEMSEEDTIKIEIILSIAIIYLEKAIMKIVHDSILDLFIMTPALWQIFIIKLYKEYIKEPKYIHYLGEFIDLKSWGL